MIFILKFPKSQIKYINIRWKESKDTQPSSARCSFCHTKTHRQHYPLFHAEKPFSCCSGASCACFFSSNFHSRCRAYFCCCIFRFVRFFFQPRFWALFVVLNFATKFAMFIMAFLLKLLECIVNSVYLERNKGTARRKKKKNAARSYTMIRKQRIHCRMLDNGLWTVVAQKQGEKMRYSYL